MLEGCRNNGLNLNVLVTLTSLLTLSEASVVCNPHCWNFFVCNDDGDREAYCCDMQSDGYYQKCCFKNDPITPEDPSDDTGDWGYTWIAVICFVLLLIISCCLRWCRRMRRQDEIDRNVEAAIQRSTARQTQAQRRAQLQSQAQLQRQAQTQYHTEIQRQNVEVRPPVASNADAPPPSYDEVTGGGTSDEYKELLSDSLYARPPNYRSTWESPPP